jgi:c-di-GMP-binding flagellar brake protein YcgR
MQGLLTGSATASTTETTPAAVAQRRPVRQTGRQMRVHLRAPVDFPVALLSPSWEDRKVLIAQAVDLSAGGMGLRCDVHLYLNEQLTLAFRVERELAPFVLQGRTCSRSRRDGAYIYGIRFFETDADVRTALSRATLFAARSHRLGLDAVAEDGGDPAEEGLADAAEDWRPSE